MTMPDQAPRSILAREISIAMGEIGLRCVFVLDTLEKTMEFNAADAARITRAIEQVGAAALEVQDAIRKSGTRKGSHES